MPKHFNSRCHSYNVKFNLDVKLLTSVGQDGYKRGEFRTVFFLPLITRIQTLFWMYIYIADKVRCL